MGLVIPPALQWQGETSQWRLSEITWPRSLSDTEAGCHLEGRRERTEDTDGWAPQPQAWGAAFRSSYPMGLSCLLSVTIL